MTYVNVGIHGTGLVLSLEEDGTVVVWPGPTFFKLMEVTDDPNGVTGFFDGIGFSLKRKGEDSDFQDYDYGVPYPVNEMPVLQAWIKQQKLGD